MRRPHAGRIDRKPCRSRTHADGDAARGFLFALSAYLLWGFLPLLHEGGRPYPGGRGGGAPHPLVGADRRRCCCSGWAAPADIRPALRSPRTLAMARADGGAHHGQLGHLCLGDRASTGRWRPRSATTSTRCSRVFLGAVAAGRAADPRAARRRRRSRRCGGRDPDLGSGRPALGVAGAGASPGASTAFSRRRCRSARARASSSRC